MGASCQLVEKACYRKICRDGSRPIRTSGRAQRIKSRRMARGFLAMSCFWQGSTERSRPFPTNQSIGCKCKIKPKKVFRQSERLARILLFKKIGIFLRAAKKGNVKKATILHCQEKNFHANLRIIRKSGRICPLFLSFAQ